MSAEVWRRNAGATAAFLGEQTSHPAWPALARIDGQAPRPIDREIKRTLHRYEKALRTSNPEGVLAVYRPDAVLMPQNAPAYVGRDAVLRAHEQVFANAALEVAFEIYEAEVQGECACARTISTARSRLANGELIERSNYELFVFRRAGLRWLIHRYGPTTDWPLQERRFQAGFSSTPSRRRVPSRQVRHRSPLGARQTVVAAGTVALRA